MGACVSRPSACVGKPHTPRSGDAGGRSGGGGGARRRRSRRSSKGRRKAPSRAASMETIQEAEGPASPSALAADHRTYSNPAFQGGSWVVGWVDGWPDGLLSPLPLSPRAPSAFLPRHAAPSRAWRF
jgi:hypothetical protein